MDWLKKTVSDSRRQSSEIDKLYDMKYITEETQYVYDTKPYKTDPRFFKKVKISILALIKMLNHTLMGGTI